ncbi:MAG: asparagine synthase (glutamine-hydrolyzing) [Planctomycetota bacterium]
MCGIAGIYSFREKIEKSWVLNMTNVLKHRGPDDEGYLAVSSKNKEVYHLIGIDSKVQGMKIEDFGKPVNLLLGHRRLSILDTSPLGHQPMSNKHKTIWIVYNGEIYNYVELKKELKSLGYEFKTDTDTEVLLAAYEKWGEQCLDRFNGMWSFVIYDRRKNILFGARDRFGVKPFYYYINDKFFAFASEIKAIVGLPFINSGTNPVAIFDYLVLGLEEIGEEGFFKNIFELPPSFAFTYNLFSNEFRKWRYYTLEYVDRWEKFDERNLQEYKTAIKKLLVDAVTIRLRSDVPVGSCLSGGIDSSTIVCIINKLLEKDGIKQIGDRQKVFTAAYGVGDVDERKWATRVVERTKTSWHKTIPKSEELLADMENLVWAQDIPFGSTSIYAQYRVMKLAKESGIKVLLDGQGGDELFTGYRGYYGTYAMEILKHFDIVRFMKEWKNTANSGVGKKSLMVLGMKAIGANVLPPILRALSFAMATGIKSYINPDFWGKYTLRMEMIKKKAKTSLNQALHEYMTGFNLKTLLRYEQTNSMKFSIESRTPFADDISLIEYVFQIPSAYKIYEGWSKYLLREATKGILPEEIRTRKDKIGFAVPECSWLKESKDAMREYLTDDLGAFFNVRKVLDDWDVLVNNQSESGITSIWRFINLAIWKKVYAL